MGLSCTKPLPEPLTRKTASCRCEPFGVGVSCVPSGSSVVITSVWVSSVPGTGSEIASMPFDASTSTAESPAAPSDFAPAPPATGTSPEPLRVSSRVHRCRGLLVQIGSVTETWTVSSMRYVPFCAVGRQAW
jgi:hypothetical protein